MAACVLRYVHSMAARTGGAGVGFRRARYSLLRVGDLQKIEPNGQSNDQLRFFKDLSSLNLSLPKVAASRPQGWQSRFRIER